MLGYLLEGLARDGVADLPIASLCIDSRRVKPGDVFIALDGLRTRGLDYLDEAIDKGAVAVLVDESAGAAGARRGAAVIAIPDLRHRLGVLAGRYYGNPSESMRVTGVTGTNGKTSVTWYLAQVLSAGGAPIGSIGTLGYGLYDSLEGALNTTPDAITLQGLLARFREQGARDAVMEVSSHALEQGRVNGVRFNSAVFTNLSRDHLDYHGDMSVYSQAKRKLFLLPGLRNAVVNVDDPYGAALAKEFRDRLNVIRYGIAGKGVQGEPAPELCAKILDQDVASMSLRVDSPWGSGEVCIPLVGRFNAANVLAVIGASCLGGMSLDEVLERLSGLRGVPGRLEYFGTPSSPKVFVDYSHTPDALQQALKSLRALCEGRLICVFGCGGDRDRGKRPEMGRVGERHADLVYVTSDNPRNEEPEAIIAEIMAGMQGRIPVEVEPDRARAIAEAIRRAGRDDIVLVAGKGHETYQEIRSVRLPFSDRQLVRNLLEEQP